jgi:hypothetical protein
MITADDPADLVPSALRQLPITATILAGRPTFLA